MLNRTGRSVSADWFLKDQNKKAHLKPSHYRRQSGAKVENLVGVDWEALKAKADEEQMARYDADKKAKEVKA